MSLITTAHAATAIQQQGAILPVSRCVVSTRITGLNSLLLSLASHDISQFNDLSIHNNTHTYTHTHTHIYIYIYIYIYMYIQFRVIHASHELCPPNCHPFARSMLFLRHALSNPPLLQFVPTRYTPDYGFVSDAMASFIHPRPKSCISWPNRVI